MRDGDARRARLQRARLYLCTAIRPDLDTFLDAVLAAGVDIVQLRDKDASARELLDAAVSMRAACDRHDALFVVNDRPDIALASHADGVHVGQDDLPVRVARAFVGDELLVGLSTHSIAEIDAAAGEQVDYLGVGPVNATPTKPGRAGIGAVTGGMDARTIPAVAAAGARGFVVVRAITDAEDGARAVREIRRAIDHGASVS